MVGPSFHSNEDILNDLVTQNVTTNKYTNTQITVNKLALVVPELATFSRS